MQFQKGYIYHIYNQGNNKRLIFLNRENCLYFLGKIKIYILPYCDIIAWCLMPNHFHLMVLVNKTHQMIDGNNSSGDFKSPDEFPVSALGRSFNDSISIMLRSYTRAFNIAHGFSGALFRPRTKAECINCPDGIAPSFFTKNGITVINFKNPELQYPQICFDYIHQNPVKAKLTSEPVGWEFSSARDYAGLRNGKLVNRNVAQGYISIFNSSGDLKSPDE